MKSQDINTVRLNVRSVLSAYLGNFGTERLDESVVILRLLKERLDGLFHTPVLLLKHLPSRGQCLTSPLGIAGGSRHFCELLLRAFELAPLHVAHLLELFPMCRLHAMRSTAGFARGIVRRVVVLVRKERTACSTRHLPLQLAYFVLVFGCGRRMIRVITTSQNNGQVIATMWGVCDA